MHFSKLALSAAAIGAVSAQQSICDKYTTALLKQNTAKNQYSLLTLLVNTVVIGNYTGPGTKNAMLPGSMVQVPGILAPGMAEGEAVNLMPYFNGALKSSNRGMPTSVNFLDGGGADPIIADPTSSGAMGSNQEKLLTHLYQFFGKLLGCSQYGMMDFPSYQGQASMSKVHQYMDLDHAQNTYFIQQVGLAAKSFGASDDDISTVAMSLNKAFNYKCSPAAEVIPGTGAQLQSICQNATCPLDPMSTCAAYPNNAVVMAPMPAMMAGGASMSTAGASPVSQISDMQPQAATSAGAVTQISDHQPQAATSAAAVTQISDHQPQAPTTAGTPMASPTMFTGAAAASAIPAVAAGAAGLVALLL